MKKYAIRILLGFSLLVNLLFFIGGYMALDRVGGFRQAWSRWKNKGVSALYQHRDSHFKQLPMRKDAIVFLGDSQIEQGEWHELCITTDAVVLNRGIAGDFVSGVQARLDEVMRHDPQMIVLEVGVNNLFFGAKPEALAEEYTELIKEIRSRRPGAQIIICSVIPVNENVSYLPVSNQVITGFNEYLKGIAKQFALPFVNLTPRLSDAEGRLASEFTSDGVHLNGGGYREWYAELKPYLRSSETN